MTARMQQRRDTAANWTSTNPTLAAGEMGLETDTYKFKVGNGSTAWATLPYSVDIPTQTGQSGKYLTTDGTTTSWATVAGDIEGVTAGTGLTGGGTSGTVTLAIDSTVATLTGSQTLTNKTLTTPVLTQGTSTPSFTTNAYTIVSTDAGLFLLASNSTTAGTISIPTDATWAAPNGTQIHIQQTGSGQLTIQAATSGTTTVVSNGAVAAAPKIRAQYSVATIMKTSTNNWTVYGDIA